MSDAVAVSSRRVDWFAVATFVLASLWLFGVGSLLAIYLGRQSLRRTRNHPEPRGRTLTWAGLPVAVLGLVMAVLAIGLVASA